MPQICQRSHKWLQHRGHTSLFTGRRIFTSSIEPASFPFFRHYSLGYFITNIWKKGLSILKMYRRFDEWQKWPQHSRYFAKCMCLIRLKAAIALKGWRISSVFFLNYHSKKQVFNSGFISFSVLLAINIHFLIIKTYGVVWIVVILLSRNVFTLLYTVECHAPSSSCWQLVPPGSSCPPKPPL